MALLRRCQTTRIAPDRARVRQGPRWRNACAVNSRTARRALEIPHWIKNGSMRSSDRVARLRHSAAAMVSYPPRTAAVIHRDGRKIRRSMASRPAASTSSALSALFGDGSVDRGGRSAAEANHPDPPQQPAGDTRRAAGAARDFVGAVRRHADPEPRAPRVTILSSSSSV